MLPKLKYHETKKVTQRISFSGLNLTDKLREGELVACSGLTDERMPFISPRYADRLAHTFAEPQGMTAADGKLFIAADGELWEYEDSTATRVMTGLSAGEKQFAYIGGMLCIFPDKRFCRPSTGETGSLEHTEYFTGYTVTANSVTRTDGVPFGFSVNDGVTLCGASFFGENSEASAVITGVSGSTLTFEGEPFREGSGTAGITISRTVPDLDFVCEHDNRLWGVSGSRVYASWLGDPCNFNAFDSAHSQASWFADVGTEGEFTACCASPSFIAFMKGDKMHKLYGTKPANYRLTLSRIPGAEKGSAASTAVSSDAIIYNSADGVYGYGGGEPEYLSAKTGRIGANAVAACLNGTYYIAADGADGKRRLYTYNLRYGVWLCDGEKDIRFMAALHGSVWYLTGEGELYELGADDSVGEWSAELAPFFDDALRRRYCRVLLKVWLAEGASLKVTANGGSGRNSIYIRRADEDMRCELPMPFCAGGALRIRLDGRGKCLLKGIVCEYIEQGAAQ